MFKLSLFKLLSIIYDGLFLLTNKENILPVIYNTDVTTKNIILQKANVEFLFFYKMMINLV